MKNMEITVQHEIKYCHNFLINVLLLFFRNLCPGDYKQITTYYIIYVEYFAFRTRVKKSNNYSWENSFYFLA